jgi:hypothetical protein
LAVCGGRRLGRARLRVKSDNLRDQSTVYEQNLPPVRARRQRRPEQQLHIQIANALPTVLKPEVLWLHIPNGGARTRIEGSILKAMGVRAGAADFLFVVAGRAVFIELKAADGRMTESQRDFAMAVTLAGGVYALAKSLEDVLGLLEPLGALRVVVPLRGTL